jgi:hypothetical protein
LEASTGAFDELQDGVQVSGHRRVIDPPGDRRVEDLPAGVAEGGHEEPVTGDLEGGGIPVWGNGQAVFAGPGDGGGHQLECGEGGFGQVAV